MIIVTVQEVDEFGHVQVNNVFTLEPYPPLIMQPTARERLEDYIKSWVQAYRR